MPNNVAEAALGIAQRSGASAKVILSLFEAGVVESNFTNHLTATDHDSLGYLQQRPSQGWPDPTNITTATNSYLKKATAYAAANPNATPGQIAQAVQRSGFPLKYDQNQAKAQALLMSIDPATAAKAATSLTSTVTGAAGGIVDGVTAVPADIVTSIAAIAKDFDQIGTVYTGAEKIGTAAVKLFLPSNLIRCVCGGFGVIFLITSFYFFGRELKEAN